MQLKYHQSLLSLGLTENQIAVYTDLLIHGEAVASYVSRRLSLDKSSTYRACDELVKIGLAIIRPKQRGSIYSAVSPEVLDILLDKKMQTLQQQKSELTSVIEILKQEARNDVRKTFISVEKGFDAYYAMQERSLLCKEKLIREKFAFTSKRHLGQKHDAYIHEYIQRRAAQGIRIQQLYDQESALVGSTSMVSSEKYLKEIRLLPTDVEDKNFFRVYDDMVTIISSDQTNDFIVVTIQDTYVASMMKSLFDFIWKRSEEYISPLSIQKLP